MKHFEDIWNAAEKLASEEEDHNLDEILQELHFRLDSLKPGIKLPRDQANNLGEILLGLATICHISQKTSEKNINIAAGLENAINNKKADILDPEEPDIPSVANLLQQHLDSSR